MDSLFFGVTISYFYHSYPVPFRTWARRWRGRLLLTGLLLLTPAFCFPVGMTPWLRTIGLTQLYLGSGCLLIAMLATTIPDRLIPRVIAYIGSHSYSIYLWHVPFAVWVVPLVVGAVKIERNWFAYFATYVVGAVAFGIISAAAVEFPLLRLRDRLFPSRGRPLGTA
jgi:peptidoglycan/LPS O-acetylase OafA/YrhL